VILLNPGPVSMTAKVRAALNAEDVCHREPEFKALVGRVREKIAGVYGGGPSAAPGQRFTPVLIGGSGTAAVETMLSVIPTSGNALVVANGVYGERMAAMLRAQNKRHEVVTTAWTSAMDIAAAEKAIATGAFGHVLAVHHETTTGRLNDLAALGAVCKKAGVPMLVDAVSSFAGEDIRWDDWNIEAAAATANKCIHGAPGVSFVLVRDAALARPSGATSVYLDLHRHAADQAKGSTPFTLPTHVTFALDAALDELAASGGWKSRCATYDARSRRVRSALRELGVGYLLDDENVYGTTLTSFRLPEGKTYEALHAHLKNDGFVIYAGQGKFDGAIFRIAVMGEITERDLDRLVASLRVALG
jgi:2-aminoethylphosphonate-pyruvate transaminase